MQLKQPMKNIEKYEISTILWTVDSSFCRVDETLVKQLHDNPSDLLGWVLESQETFKQLILTIAPSQI